MAKCFFPHKIRRAWGSISRAGCYMPGSSSLSPITLLPLNSGSSTTLSLQHLNLITDWQASVYIQLRSWKARKNPDLPILNGICPLGNLLSTQELNFVLHNVHSYSKVQILTTENYAITRFTCQYQQGWTFACLVCPWTCCIFTCMKKRLWKSGPGYWKKKKKLIWGIY